MLRGNATSGKTSVARAARRRYGRGCALVEQDYLRRIILREHDSSKVPDALLHEWYLPLDLLGVDGERVIPESSTFEQSVTTVVDSLADAPAQTPCPVLCPRCPAERGGQHLPAVTEP